MTFDILWLLTFDISLNEHFVAENLTKKLTENGFRDCGFLIRPSLDYFVTWEEEQEEEEEEEGQADSGPVDTRPVAGGHGSEVCLCLVKIDFWPVASHRF